MSKKDIPIIRLPSGTPALPSNDQWENRFEIRSESSNRIYVVAQNIKNRFWSCSCPGWKAHRKCKHLSAIGLPNNQIPYEAKLKQ